MVFHVLVFSNRLVLMLIDEAGVGIARSLEKPTH